MILSPICTGWGETLMPLRMAPLVMKITCCMLVLTLLCYIQVTVITSGYLGVLTDKNVLVLTFLMYCWLYLILPIDRSNLATSKFHGVTLWWTFQIIMFKVRVQGQKTDSRKDLILTTKNPKEVINISLHEWQLLCFLLWLALSSDCRSMSDCSRITMCFLGS